MTFRDGKLYTIQKLSTSHPYWQGVSAAIKRRTKPNAGPLKLVELYEVRWRQKPFPWSWKRQFKPNRRWFYHGTTKQIIQRILDEGFKIPPPRHGRMLGQGVYLTYHTNKSIHYGPDGYVISVMVYAPNVLLVNPGQSIDQNQIQNAPLKYDAIEVRTGAIVRAWTMRNHEICVFNPLRVVPRFICKIQ